MSALMTNPIKKLIQQSQYISSMCITELRKDELSRNYWYHSIPLKDETKHYRDSTNWAVSCEEIEKVIRYNDSLKKYASSLCSQFDYANSVLKGSAYQTTNILPPWIVFPLFSCYTMGWRMGLREDYKTLVRVFLKSLTLQEKELYVETYPRPIFYPQNWGGLCY